LLCSIAFDPAPLDLERVSPRRDSEISDSDSDSGGDDDNKTSLTPSHSHSHSQSESDTNEIPSCTGILTSHLLTQFRQQRWTDVVIEVKKCVESASAIVPDEAPSESDAVHEIKCHACVISRMEYFDKILSAGKTYTTVAIVI
jgi:hypothetical protein